MPKYIIITRSTHRREYVIEADTAGDAEDAFRDGDSAALIKDMPGRESVYDVFDYREQPTQGGDGVGV